jgi:hypothetical protein
MSQGTTSPFLARTTESSIKGILTPGLAVVALLAALHTCLLLRRRPPPADCEICAAAVSRKRRCPTSPLIRRCQGAALAHWVHAASMRLIRTREFQQPDGSSSKRSRRATACVPAVFKTRMAMLAHHIMSREAGGRWRECAPSKKAGILKGGGQNTAGGEISDKALVADSPRTHQEPWQPRRKQCQAAAGECGARLGLWCQPWQQGTSKPSYTSIPRRESGAKLFLGGLSWDTTEGRGLVLQLVGCLPQAVKFRPLCRAEKLSQHFGEYGEIIEGNGSPRSLAGRCHGASFGRRPHRPACGLLCSCRHARQDDVAAQRLWICYL